MPGSFFLPGILLAAALAVAFHVHGFEYLLIAAVLATLIAASLVVRAPDVDAGLRNLDLAVAALTAWIVLAALASDARWTSDVYATRFLALPAAYLVARLCNGPARRALLLALTAIIAYANADTLYEWRYGDIRADTLFPNPNNLAGWLGVASLACVPLVSEGSRWLRASVAVVLVAAGLAFALLASRGAAAGLITGVLVLIAAAFWCRQPLRRIAPGVAAFGLGIAVAFIIPNPGMLEAKGAETAEFIAGPTGATGSRLTQWRSALPLLAEARLTGVGPGLTADVWQQHRTPVDQSAGYHLHNDYIQYAIESGWPAGLLLLALAAVALISVAHDRASVALYRLSALAAVCALFAHSALTFNLQLFPMLLLAGLMLGLSQPASTPIRGLRIGVGALLGLAILQMGLIGALLPPAPKVGDAASIQRSLDGLTRVIAIRPDADGIRTQYAELLRQAMPHMTAGSAPLAATYRHAFDHYSAAIDANRYSHAAYLGRALLQMEGGAHAQHPDLAEQDLRNAVRLRPQAPVARMTLARMLAARGDAHAALEVLRDGLDWVHMPVPGTSEYLHMTVRLATQLDDSSTIAKALDILRRYGVTP